MSFSTKQVVDTNIALLGLIQADRENKIILSSAVRIRLAGILRKTKPIFEDYKEENTALFKKFGSLNKNGELEVAQNSPGRPLFDEAIKAMNAEPTEIESFPEVTHEELFGKVQKTKDGEKPENQIDLDVLSILMEVGILKE